HDETNYLQLSIKTSKQKKNGGWSRSHGSEYLSVHLIDNSYVNNDDVNIITAMVRGNTYKQDVISFDIYEQLINTHRCFWLASYDLDQPIQLGEDIQANWQWQVLENNMQSLQLILKNPSDNIRIIKSQPIAYYDSRTNSIGRIISDSNSNFEVNLLNSPLIEEEKLPWVISKLNISLGEDSKRLPKPKLNKKFELSKPIVRLRFSTPNDHDHLTGTVQISFDYHGNLVGPNVLGTVIRKAKNIATIYRDIALEHMVVEMLKEQGFKKINIDNSMMLQGRNCWLSFLHNQLPVLEKQGWQITFDDDFYYQELETNGVFDAEISQDEGNDFFSIGLNLDVAGKKLPAFPILYNAIEQLPRAVLLNQDTNLPDDYRIYIDVEQGKFIALSYGSIKPLLKQFVELFMPSALQKDGTLQLSRFQGHQTLAVLDDAGVISSGEKKLRALANKLKNFDKIANVTIPKQLKAPLREYQHQGLNWLQFLREYELNGILADDMGLGKTIQTLANLLCEKQQQRLTKPCLIIAPTSVIFNWTIEIDKFAPALTYQLINGAKRHKHFDTIEQNDVIITSYALVTKDIKNYNKHDFYYVILDESHYIKNPKTKLYQSIIQLKAQYKICLTGTPMENHLGEFWSQFNFLLPGFLGGHRQFTKLFRTPIEKQDNQERKLLLNKRIKPFILRRTKDKVAEELPSKTIIVQTLRIEGKQAELYESVRLSMDSRIKKIITDKGINRSQIEILDALLKLRQVCNHPKLLPFESAKSIDQSAKLDYLMDTLPEQIIEGRRILIFSQFTSMLSLISEVLDQENIDYLKLTGSTRNRQPLIDKFQNGEVAVFLISLRAGGVGLNLTAADTVIHVDPWWNPAVEDQATDRAHRIGQKKPVFVYKLIIKNSIEEKIHEIQKNKAELAKALLSEEVSQSKLSLTDDVLEALMSPLD
ncbi:MAG: DEAD/DEAH box helicase, partial [Gammaproteobacteria bacterium]|nr:DEAD/DEAH box helicase [Gammaproteobacteria bacterium]